MENKDQLKIKGSFNVKVLDKDGNLLNDSGWIENIITYVGKAVLSGLAVNSGALTAFGYLALGTSTTAVTAGDTALGVELSTLGLSRSTATASQVNSTTPVGNQFLNDTAQLTHTWTVAGGSTTIQEIGIFNASSSGTMLAHQLTGALAVINTNQVVATYKVTFA